MTQLEIVVDELNNYRDLVGKLRTACMHEIVEHPKRQDQTYNNLDRAVNRGRLELSTELLLLIDGAKDA